MLPSRAATTCATRRIRGRSSWTHARRRSRSASAGASLRRRRSTCTTSELNDARRRPARRSHATLSVAGTAPAGRSTRFTGSRVRSVRSMTVPAIALGERGRRGSGRIDQRVAIQAVRVGVAVRRARATRTPAPRSRPVVSSSTLPSSSRIDVVDVSSTKSSANEPPRRRATRRTSWARSSIQHGARCYPTHVAGVSPGTLPACATVSHHEPAERASDRARRRTPRSRLAGRSRDGPAGRDALAVRRPRLSVRDRSGHARVPVVDACGCGRGPVGRRRSPRHARIDRRSGGRPAPARGGDRRRAAGGARSLHRDHGRGHDPGRTRDVPALVAWVVAGTLAGLFAVHLGAGYLANLAFVVAFLAAGVTLLTGGDHGRTARQRAAPGSAVRSPPRSYWRGAGSPIRRSSWWAGRSSWPWRHGRPSPLETAPMASRPRIDVRTSGLP